MLKIKKGDFVLVISGKDKNKKGKVYKVFPKQKKVLVENINLVKKHVKPNQNKPKGSVIHKEMPIHVSNLSHLDPKSGLRTKIKYDYIDGNKVRVSKKSGEIIDKGN